MASKKVTGVPTQSALKVFKAEEVKTPPAANAPKKWELLGAEEFKGKFYLKFKNNDPGRFGKPYMNINQEQAAEILANLPSLREFVALKA